MHLIPCTRFCESEFFANHSESSASINLEHTSHTQISEPSLLMFPEPQSSRLDRMYEANAFGGSDWPSDNELRANAYLPGNLTAMDALGTKMLT